MVQSVYVEKSLSKRADGKEYCALVFDCGYRKVRVFADTQTLLVLTGFTAEKFFSLKVGDTVPLIGLVG